MIILQHPITANVVLVTTSDAENFTLIGNESPTEFRDEEIVVQEDLVAGALVDVVEVNVLGAPLEVVDIFP